MTVLLREAIGERLRHTRTNQRRTLREVSRAARVSLGYLSEVERGRKEASSELLAAICDALELPLSELLHNVAAVVSCGTPVPEEGGVHPAHARATAIDMPAEHLPAADVATVLDGADGGDSFDSACAVEGGRLLPTAMGEELSDLRLQPALTHRLSASMLLQGAGVPHEHGASRSSVSIGQPRKAVVVAA